MDMTMIYCAAVIAAPLMLIAYELGMLRGWLKDLAKKDGDRT